MTSRRLGRLLALSGVLVGILTRAAPAIAQAPVKDRVFVDVNLGVEEGSPRLAVTTPLPAFGREGTLTVDDTFGGGVLLDASAMVRVRGGLAVGAGYSRMRTDAFPQYTAVIPSPIGTNLPVTVNDTTPRLAHAEAVVYINAAWMRAKTDRFVYVLSAGPAFFTVHQDIPFTSAVLNLGILAAFTPTASMFTESAVGFHAGIDLNYMLGRHLGGGLLLHYTRGSVEFPFSTAPMTVGGAQIGVGVRARF